MKGKCTKNVFKLESCNTDTQKSGLGLLRLGAQPIVNTTITEVCKTLQKLDLIHLSFCNLSFPVSSDYHWIK